MNAAKSSAPKLRTGQLRRSLGSWFLPFVEVTTRRTCEGSEGGRRSVGLTSSLSAVTRCSLPATRTTKRWSGGRTVRRAESESGDSWSGSRPPTTACTCSNRLRKRLGSFSGPVRMRVIRKSSELSSSCF